VLALAPELVAPERPERAPTSGRDDEGVSYRIERHGSWQATDGFTDSPAGATAADGERYLAAIVDAVARALVDFYRRTRA
jgi:creatinine amidohydrolase/Fe(II)-dependent formamide hydrolase-like protein